jgi:hypothetical protein
VSRQGWLADAARRWHLPVVEVDGWQSRGSSDFSPRGLVDHHTAGPSGGGDMPSLNVVTNGRAGHARSGGWQGLSGNSSVVGIEAENDGYQPWPEEQVIAYRKLSAAICEALGVPAGMVCRHHEWRSEKPDPHDVDGDTGRAAIAELLAFGPGGPPAPGPNRRKRRRQGVEVISSRTGGKTAFIIGEDLRVYWAGVGPGGDLAAQPFAPIGGDGLLLSIGASYVGDGDDIVVVGQGLEGPDGHQFMYVNEYRSGAWTGWRQNPHGYLIDVP